MALDFPSIPNTFTAGSSAKSAEVNANFTALRNAIANFYNTAVDYTITDSDGYRIIYVTAGASSFKTITLPTAADNEGRIITIKKVDTGAGYVVIDGEGSETIEGLSLYELRAAYDYVTLQCNGTLWYVIGGSNPFQSLQVYPTRMQIYDIAINATTTVDLTVSTYFLSSRLCAVPAIYDNTSTTNWADEDYSIERPTTTTLRFRVGVTTTANIRVMVMGQGWTYG